MQQNSVFLNMENDGVEVINSSNPLDPHDLRDPTLALDPLDTQANRIARTARMDRLDRLERGELIPVDQHKAEIKELDSTFNTYATSKSVSQMSLNTSSIQSLIYIFVLLLSTPGGILTGFQIALLIFIPTSLILQFVIFVLLIILAKSSSEQITKNCTATSMNSTVTALSGLLVIVTAAITIISWKAGVGSTTLPPSNNVSVRCTC